MVRVDVLLVNHTPWHTHHLRDEDRECTTHPVKKIEGSLSCVPRSTGAACRLIPDNRTPFGAGPDCGISRRFILVCNEEEIHFFVDFPAVGNDTWGVTNASAFKTLDCSLSYCGYHQSVHRVTLTVFSQPAPKFVVAKMPGHSSPFHKDLIWTGPVVHAGVSRTKEAAPEGDTQPGDGVPPEGEKHELAF